MGVVLSAVSLAVVVPRMVKLIEEKWGTQKSIPQMILAGTSCDDIFVIVLGVLPDTLVGTAVYFLFEKSYQHKHSIRNSTKVIILLGYFLSVYEH